MEKFIYYNDENGKRRRRLKARFKRYESKKDMNNRIKLRYTPKHRRQSSLHYSNAAIKRHIIKYYMDKKLYYDKFLEARRLAFESEEKAMEVKVKLDILRKKYITYILKSSIPKVNQRMEIIDLNRDFNDIMNMISPKEFRNMKYTDDEVNEIFKSLTKDN